jgi:predicted ATPase
MPPYLPLLQAVGQYIHAAPEDQLRSQAAIDLEILASFFPELATRLAIPLTTTLGTPEQQRWRFYHAFGCFLETISMTAPLLLLLDDIHQADAESLSLLCYIARHHPKARLLILGTIREGIYEQNQAFVHTLAELTRHRVLAMLKMPMLSLRDVELVALAYLGKPIDPAVRLLLYAKSEGNPFMVEELLHCWVETQAIVQENGQWVLAASVNNLCPVGAINRVRQQLAHLHPETIGRLRMAALIGRTFDVSLLAALEGQEVETVESCLQEAVRACLLVPTQAGTLRFSHWAIYNYLYHDTTASRRQRLHGSLAHLLEARYGEETARDCKQLAELAHHFACSGERIRGSLYARHAAALGLSEYISQAFEALLKESFQSTAGDKSVQASLPGKDKHSCLKCRKEARACSQSTRRLLALVTDLETIAYLTEELELVEWRQEVLSVAQEMLEQIQTLEEKFLCPAEIRLLMEQAAPLVSHIGHHPEGQAHAQLILELACCLAENQAAPNNQPLEDKHVLSSSQSSRRSLTHVGASSSAHCDI